VIISQKSYVLHHIIFITAYGQNVFLQYERKRWTLTRLANNTFNNARPRAAPSLLMRHFSSSTYDFKTNRLMLNMQQILNDSVVSVIF